MSGKGQKTCTAVAPTDSATLLLAANPLRVAALLTNASDTVVTYVGNSAAVTTSTGTPLAVGVSIEDFASQDAWYGITASGTGAIRVIEVS